MRPHLYMSTNPDPPQSDVGTRPRIALYSHDTMGLGHLRRNILIATALSKPPINADSLVISGAREACHFAMSAGVDCVTLPAICKNSEGQYTGKHYHWSYQKTTSLRSKIIAASLDAFAPDIFIVDKVARGIGNELDDSLRMIRSRGTTRCVLGLREILDEPNAVIRQWIASDAEKIIRDHYDEVWIYGDRLVYDAVRQYGFGPCTSERTFYTGYLNQKRRLKRPSTPNRNIDVNKSLVVCVVGGGQDGTSLANAFSLARLPTGWQGILITGPFMSDSDKDQIRQTLAGRSDCAMVEELVEADQYIAIADRVVSMAGYNTISSILSFEKASLVVPRVAPRREQWIRARQLADRGLLTAIEPDEISPTMISDWIAMEEVPTAKGNSIDLCGLNRVIERVEKLLPVVPTIPTENDSEVSIV